MSDKVIEIESTSVEALIVSVWAQDDPTGDAVEFVLTEDTVTDPPSGSFTPANWDPAYPWDDVNRTPKARTSTLGGPSATMQPVDAAGSPVGFDEGQTFRLWSRLGGSVVDRVAFIKAT